MQPAQLAILEENWDRWKRWCPGSDRPPKRQSITIAGICRRAGRYVTSQDVGRYYALRAASEAGRPRAQQKTPGQLKILERAFSRNPYPLAGRMIQLVHNTKLKSEQVKQWFDYQRKKHEKNGTLRILSGREQDPHAALRMWREYKKDPDGYAEKLSRGIICVRTGVETSTEFDPENRPPWDEDNGDEDEVDEFCRQFDDTARFKQLELMSQPGWLEKTRRKVELLRSRAKDGNDVAKNLQ